jgi:hypothetical protein
MRAAGLALACVVIVGGAALGYVAADREFFASLRLLDFFNGDPSASEAKIYPLANREGKYDRMVPLRTERADFEPEPPVLQRGDSLRQSYAAVDPAATPVLPSSIEPPPLPKPRPKAQLLRRLQSSYTLLSDLQIDAIKARLKLTAEQERSWPVVEVALRGLATRLHEMKKSGETPTDLSPDSAELVQLKTAATPFFAQLNADQKRELKMLAHLIGLGKVMAQL